MAAGSTARQFHTQQTHYLRKSITYSDIGSTVSLGKVPIGAIVVDAYVVVSTGFNSGSTDILDIGTSDDTDGFATDLDLQTAGKIAADELATSNDLGPYASETELKAVVAATGTAASAGAAEVVVEFIPDNDG
jgi:deoxycytidylate deaminase